MRYRRDVLDRRDAESARVQRTHRRFAPGPRSADAHLEVFHPALLRGAAGEGIARGSILLGDGVNPAVIIDLSAADSVQDVINRINESAPGGMTAAIGPDGRSLRISGGTQITVNETGGGTTARDLGILSPAPAGATLDGQDVLPKVTPLTTLAQLASGGGIDAASGLIITNGVRTATLAFDPSDTVEAMLIAINAAGVGVLARINAAGDGIDIINTVQGTDLTIAENGGTTAADLGVRSFSPAAALADLNGGKGVRTRDGADLLITRADGSAFEVEIDGLLSVQDVIDAINAADAGGGVSASFAAVGNGIVLTDSTGGSGTLRVASANYSEAWRDLGLDEPATGNQIRGRDVHVVQASGLFANLQALRSALLASDQDAITEAAGRLQGDLDRLIRIRGQAGARVQELESRLGRMEDQNLSARSLLSGLEDADLDEVISRFQTLQTALQANYLATSKILDLSLLDFLG